MINPSLLEKNRSEVENKAEELRRWYHRSMNKLYGSLSGAKRAKAIYHSWVALILGRPNDFSSLTDEEYGRYYFYLEFLYALYTQVKLSWGKIEKLLSQLKELKEQLGSFEAALVTYSAGHPELDRFFKHLEDTINQNILEGASNGTPRCTVPA